MLVCCVWIGLAANLRHLILLLDELQAVGVSWCIHEPKNAGGQRLTAPQSHAPYRAYGQLFQ